MKSKIYLVLSILSISVIFLAACDRSEFAHGKRLYDDYCESCHMETGEGLASLIPSLDSDYYRANTEKIPCIIQNGIQATITVNGKSFNQAMPANKNLSATDIANLINYIDNILLQEKIFSSVKIIEARLENCQSMDN